MSDHGTTATTQPEEESPAVSRQQEPGIPEPAQPPESAQPAESAEDPGYLTRTGEAVG
jgi:hypothetical protein